MLRADAGTVRVFGADPWADPQALMQRVDYLDGHDDWPALIRVRDVLGVQTVQHTVTTGQVEQRGWRAVQV